LGADRPELASELLVDRLLSNDVEGLRDLYETDAVFADDEGTATGWSEIKAAHQRFLDTGLTLRLIDSVVFQADGIALVHWSWTVTEPDGVAFDGTSAEVLRRQADGSWKFLIDNSDGPALIGLI
jgi:ketosteroid isomerase-like protein